MGWTHDYRDVARLRSGKGAAARVQSTVRLPSRRLDPDSHTIGFPHILRRRARWVSTRLRHPRS
ncbi:hypothetical protein PJ985_02895 [Streptomyces sp. ACA25]|nr:hypothetical protein [Streptomyces sp. ACA25]MDB1086514.1 hypothetical protein [Streptomyces sp. ACA25]